MAIQISNAEGPRCLLTKCSDSWLGVVLSTLALPDFDFPLVMDKTRQLVVYGDSDSDSGSEESLPWPTNYSKWDSLEASLDRRKEFVEERTEESTIPNALKDHQETLLEEGRPTAYSTCESLEESLDGRKEFVEERTEESTISKVFHEDEQESLSQAGLDNNQEMDDFDLEKNQTETASNMTEDQDEKPDRQPYKIQEKILLPETRKFLQDVSNFFGKHVNLQRPTSALSEATQNKTRERLLCKFM
jgi:hypothetical protein